MESLYKKLYEEYKREYPKRGIVKVEEVAVFVPIRGNKYTISDKIRLMVVGRATNGWDKEFDYIDATSFGTSASDCIENENRFGWIEDAARSGYFLSTSPFWRATKDIYMKLAEGEKDASYDWINHIVWSNLYKISRQNGNPTTTMCCAQFEACKELLKKEIEYFEPTHVVFMTGYKYWIKDEGANTDRRIRCSFDDLLEDVHYYEGLCNSTIEAYGHRIAGKNVKFVVTCRPEGKNEKTFVDAVCNCFEELESRVTLV